MLVLLFFNLCSAFSYNGIAINTNATDFNYTSLDKIQQCIRAANLNATLELEGTNNTVVYAYLTETNETNWDADQNQCMDCIKDNVDLSALVMPNDDDDKEEEDDDESSAGSATSESGASSSLANSAISTDLSLNSSSALSKRCWAPYWAETTYTRYFWMDTSLSKKSATGSNIRQSHYGFQCGRCYSWAGTGTKSVQVINTNEDVNISFMWWPYEACQSKTIRSKTKKGTKVWVKKGVSQHFKIAVRSFYVQCDKNDEWPDTNTGDTPTWPVLYL